MERDFMGLTHKVKQEVVEEPTDPAPARSSTSKMQWSSPNNVSANRQYLSFKGAQEDAPIVGFDSLASTGLVTITTTEAVDSSRRPYSGVIQKNMMLEKQGGTNYTMMSIPPHHIDAQPLHQRTSDGRIVPVANPTDEINVSMAMHGHKSIISPVGQNLISATNPLPSPVASPVSVTPSGSAVVGTTDLRSAPRTSTGPAQLTIFYAGSVCVYENVSPEKAQAIMLLAGNAPPVTPSATSTPSPVPIPVPVVVQAPIPKSSAVQPVVVNQCHTTPTHSSPISITSHGALQSARVSSNTNTTTTTPQSQTGWGQLASSKTNTATTTITIMPQSQISWAQLVASNINMTTTTPQFQTSWGQLVSSNTNGVAMMKSFGVLSSPSMKAAPSNVASSLGSPCPILIPSAVPQARKASLARFLEKRKERVISVGPYPSSKQPAECSTSTTPGSVTRSLSMNSSSSCPPHVINLV